MKNLDLISRDYEELNKKEEKLYDKQQASLSPELFEILSDFLEVVMAIHTITEEQYFTAGFKIGLQIATEAFNLSYIFDL